MTSKPLQLLALMLFALPAFGQLGERPGTSADQSDGPMDFSGLSVKTPRIRAVHTTDPSLAGGSMYLQMHDPFLAFKLGKDLTQREFRVRDGVFAVQDAASGVSGLAGKLTDGVTPAIVANDQVSCGGCHNVPYRDAGGGTNFAKKAGLGRNATHFFGSGIQEMIAWQIRQKMMQQIDTNRNNRVDLAEMNGNPLLVHPTPGATPIDYGTSGDLDGDGWPDLNNIFRVWFVDADGKVLTGAKGIGDAGVAGYNFVLEVFGWGEKRFNLNTTNRIFAWDPFKAHGSLEAYDPTTAFDPDFDGFSQVSNAGFQQSWIGHIPPDHGNSLNSVGLSVDDPDGDGSISEITEGDLDLVEWYMLNSPRPGVGRQTPQTIHGRQRFIAFGCDGCHVLDWLIEAADPTNPDLHKRYNGDLRAFDFDVRWDEELHSLRGHLIPLFDEGPNGEAIPRRGSFLVKGIGTDFKHHPMGIAFNDIQYDGGVARAFRTGLLWGNGTTGFPWGHDGLSMTIDDVIRRHGGDSRVSRNRYVTASQEDQDAVVAWLSSLVLYPTDQIPADVDGDGEVSTGFLVADRNTGVERFNPEWLFANPGRIEGRVAAPDGGLVLSFALQNVRQAYGLDLPYMLDSDLDGFPDVTDECPQLLGYKNGCS